MLLEPAQAGDLMRAILEYHGHPATRTALLLSALLFQRPRNIRQMEWTELDLEAAMWSIPSDKMKRTKQHKVNGRKDHRRGLEVGHRDVGRSLEHEPTLHLIDSSTALLRNAQPRRHAHGNQEAPFQRNQRLSHH